MMWPSRSQSADGIDHFCERCGHPVRAEAGVARARLRTCRACGIHACARCWGRSVGSCPACGVAVAATALLRSLPEAAGGPATPAKARPARPRRSLDRPLAAGAGLAAVLAITLVALGSLFGKPAAFTGDVAGIEGTPGSAAAGTIGPSHPLLPSGSAVAGGPTTPPTARPTARPAGGDLAGEPTGPGSTARPVVTPGPTRAPTPDPTAAPTPRPTPKPTPDPTPKPTPEPSSCTAIVPTLVGERRSDAHRLWVDAGFSGAVVVDAGQGNFVIGSQTPAAGRRAACDSDVRIAPADG